MDRKSINRHDSPSLGRSSKRRRGHVVARVESLEDRQLLSLLPGDTADFNPTTVDVNSGTVGKSSMTTTLFVPPSVTFGQAASLSAVVHGSGAVDSTGHTVPAGTLQFFDNGIAIPNGSVPVSSPSATGSVTVPLMKAPGHTITATYSLTNPSDSNSYALGPIAPQSVNVAPAQVALSADPLPPSGYYQSVSITAHLGAGLPAGAAAALTQSGGQIQFLDETGATVAPAAQVVGVGWATTSRPDSSPRRRINITSSSRPAIRSTSPAGRPPSGPGRSRRPGSRPRSLLPRGPPLGRPSRSRRWSRPRAGRSRRGPCSSWSTARRARTGRSRSRPPGPSPCRG